ncbi:hypothetical protein GF420_08590 [candidate division GN15 bacterium]|nr:hypothetical protein [candidate division GN15 bacterium]
MYLEIGEFHDALEAARRATMCDPEFEEGHRIVARIMIVIGEYERAIASLKQCLHLNDDEPIYYWWLSTVCVKLGRNAAASLYAREARRLEGGA